MSAGHASMFPEERVAWLRLARTQGVGPVTFRDLIARFETAAAAMEAAPRLARRGGRKRPLALHAEEDAHAELARLEEIGARLFLSKDNDYPRRLAALDAPPPVLATRGPIALDAPRAIALVGARNASAAARSFAHDLARALAEAGVLVVSGMARGVDTAAHRGALDQATAAVLAGGLDRVYPPENRDLHVAIGDRGVLVSERALGVSPQARDFPRRNRLISGLCDGVVVVEAAERSGSLITARLAGEQGREVMAVPGHPSDPRARGANSLLKDGAALIETADDVFNAISGVRRLNEPPADPTDLFSMPDAALDREAESVRQRVLALLSPAPVTRDEIVRHAAASASAVMAALMELELAGLAVQLPGDLVIRAPADADD